MTASTEFPQYQWIPAKSWTRGRQAGQPTVIFIHTTQGSEGPTSAENGALYDQRRTDGTSTHFFCDSNSTVQCVKTTDESHTARRHGNDVGIHIEICGRAEQSDAQWADAVSAATIEQAAKLGVALRKKYGKARFPLVNLTPSQLRAGGKGFAEHYDATRAWPEDSGSHWDPGPNFPWGKMFNRIQELEGDTMRQLVFQTIQADVPILKYGDDEQNTKPYVVRAQMMLDYVTVPEVVADGIYGDQTAAAVRAVMGTGDGKTIDFHVWRRLCNWQLAKLVDTP